MVELVEPVAVVPRFCLWPFKSCMQKGGVTVTRRSALSNKFLNSISLKVKSGKSCLFSLTPEQAMEATRTFDVNLDIFKKMQPGFLPEKVQVGNCLISIANLFVELIDSITSSTGEAPSAKTLKDTFKITGNTGQVIGELGIYIRMSCFGKLIVTQFQMNLQDKSVLFKDKEGHSLYRYKKAGKKTKVSLLNSSANVSVYRQIKGFREKASVRHGTGL